MNVEDSLPKITSADDDLQYDDGLDSWMAVVASFTVSVVVIGIPTSFGVLQQYFIANNLSYQGPHSIFFISIIGATLNSCLSVFAIPAGYAVDKYGNQNISFYSGMFIAVFYLIGSYSVYYWQILLFIGIGLGCANSFAYFSALTITSHYFQRRRGLANGIAVSGASVGGMLVSPLLSVLLKSFGWQKAIRILGVSGGLIVTICSIFLKERRKKRMDKTLNYYEVLIDGRFIRLFFSTIMVSLGFLLPYFLLPEFAVENGMSEYQGSLLISMINASSGIGKILLGYNADFIGQINACWICLLTASISSLLLWPFCSSFVSLLVFSSIYGSSLGGFMAILPSSISHLFIQDEIASITGMIYSGFFVGDFFGSPIAGFLIDSSSPDETQRNFTPAMIFGGICIFTGSLFLLSVKLFINKNFLSKV